MALHIGAGKVTFSKNTHDKITPRKSGTKSPLGVSRKSILASIRKKNSYKFSAREQRILQLKAKLQNIKKAISLLSNKNENKNKKHSLQLSYNEGLIHLNEMQKRQSTRRKSYPIEDELPSWSSNNNTNLDNDSNNNTNLDNYDSLTKSTAGGRRRTRHHKKRRHNKKRSTRRRQ